MLRLRPHHVLDIVRKGQPAEAPPPAESGNAVHVVAAEVARDLDQPVEFVLGADDVCAPCTHLRPDGSCERILDRHHPPEPMDAYNNALDGRLFEHLDMHVGDVMTMRQFLQRVSERLDGMEAACAAPGRRGLRFLGLQDGLLALRISLAG